MDIGVIPSENMSTDHMMAAATNRKETRISSIGRTFQRQSVNSKNLMEPDINHQYQETISYNLEQLPNKLNSASWILFEQQQKIWWDTDVWRTV